MSGNYLMTLAGIAIWGWAFWRINETHAQGEWALKFQVMLIFVSITFWLLDRSTGNTYTIDAALFLFAIAVYLWWGIFQHVIANRRRRRRPVPSIGGTS